MDAKQDGADAKEIAKGVAALGLRHHLVTRHTSLVAVERVPVAPRDALLETRNVPTHLPRGWSHAHVFGAEKPAALVVAAQGMPRTATPAALWLRIGAFALAMAMLLAAIPRLAKGRAG